MPPEQVDYLIGYHTRSCNRFRMEGGEISLKEWLAFWDGHPLLSIKMERPFTVVLAKKDDRKAWTVDNLRAVTRRDRVNEISIKAKRQVRNRVNIAPGSRLLTVDEWLEEVRAK